MKHDFPDKIIFLDIDGVICTPKLYYQAFDPECMCRLEQIIDTTGAKIVVSSSWRDSNTERMKEVFLEHGCTQKIWDSIIGITCRGYNNVIKGSKLPIVRGNEIKEWIDTRLIYPWHNDKSLTEHYSVPDVIKKDGSRWGQPMKTNLLGVDFSYVILDDDTDMLYDQKDNFIHTSQYYLTDEDVSKAIKILNYNS